MQRYGTPHSAARLVGQTRQEDVLLHQQQQHSALVQQSPEGSVFYQHSPSTNDVHPNDNHPEDGGEVTTVTSRKYSECQSNGHDSCTLTDFVTFVCQETEQSGNNQNNRNSPKSQQYSQYNTLPVSLTNQFCHNYQIKLRSFCSAYAPSSCNTSCHQIQ